MTEESPAARYARDFGAMDTNDPNRKDRTLDAQSNERKARLYVDPSTIDYDEDGNPVPYSGTSATGATYTP